MLFINEPKEIKVMKIGSGKLNQVDANGNRIRLMGYATRNGRALVSMLEKHHTVKVMAVGEASANNMVKVITHANQELKEKGKFIVADDFAFEDVDLSSGESTSHVKALAITLHVEVLD